jgi:hypothetical protein
MESIFEIIWVFVIIYFLYRTFFAPARRTQQQQGQRQETSTSTDREEQSTRTKDEILDELRTIFGTPQKPVPPKPQKRPQPEMRQAPAKKDKYASFTGTDFIDTSAMGVLENWDEPLLESPGLAQKAEGGKSFDFLYNFDDIRQGIIISEVLGKPKSLGRR